MDYGKTLQQNWGAGGAMTSRGRTPGTRSRTRSRTRARTPRAAAGGRTLASTADTGGGGGGTSPGIFNALANIAGHLGELAHGAGIPVNQVTNLVNSGYRSFR